MNIGSKIRSFRQKNNYTLKKLSQITGVSSTYLSDIEKGRSTPSVETLLKLAKAIRITPGYLLNEEFMIVSEDNNDLMPYMANIPVMKDCKGKIDFKYADSKTETVQTVIIDDPAQLSELFFFRVRDNSMTGSRINKDDLVLVKRQDYAVSGSVCLVWLPPNEIILRRVFKEGKGFIIQSDNPDFKPVIINQQNDFKIIGKALKVMFDLE